MPGLKYHTTNGSGETIAIKDILKDKTATLESKHFPICLHLQVGTFCWSFEHDVIFISVFWMGQVVPEGLECDSISAIGVLLFDLGDVEKRDPKAASCHKQLVNDFTMISMGQQSL